MLETIWFLLWGLIWGIYFMLDGFDFGLGMLLPFITHSDKEKRIIYNSMGPFWDGNEVWLITAGGVTFAAKPRSFKQKVNKKMFKGAMRSILSELLRQDRLMIVDSVVVESPKTKLFIQQLETWKVDGRVLIISDEISEELYLATRNLPQVDVRDVASAAADPVALVGTDKVIVTKAAIKEIEGLLK